MASLEKRGEQFRAVFWFRGQRYRSLKTTSERAALGRLARLDDNLRRVELALLTPPPDVDHSTFLLCDGQLASRPAPPTVRTLRQVLDAYFQAVPTGALELSTIAGMQTHATHLKRILGATCPLQGPELGDLQRYIERRARDKGLPGRKVSPATIKKDIVRGRFRQA